MRVACFHIFIFVSGLLAVGCGGGVNVSTSESNVCAEIAEVACNNLYRCCTEGEIEGFLDVSEPRTEPQCRVDLERRCERMTVSLRDSLEAGRVKFMPELMNACLNAIVAPEDTCGMIVSDLPWEEACEESAWIGTVEIGGSCFFNHDCVGAPDSFCAPNQKCTAKPTAGFPCGSGCASDFFCGTGGVCQPKLAVGGPCASNLQCQEDLFCDTAALPMPVCATAMPAGSPCTSNAACTSGECSPGQCARSSQECFRDLECFSRCADDGFICDDSSDCSIGTCSVGGNSCLSQISCTAGTGDTCVFPVLCLPGDCIGDPICTEEIRTVNFCSSISALPQL